MYLIKLIILGIPTAAHLRAAAVRAGQMGRQAGHPAGNNCSNWGKEM